MRCPRRFIRTPAAGNRAIRPGPASICIIGAPAKFLRPGNYAALTVVVAPGLTGFRYQFIARLTIATSVAIYALMLRKVGRGCSFRR
jgi:hypothetical protein